jgi:hypothetical protein
LEEELDMSGRDTFQGIGYQALSAMALFLQHINQKDFSHIHLEAPGWADFNLVFEGGRKIICEAKSYKRGVQEYNIKEILSGLNKKKRINEQDEILIVCKKYSTQTFSQAGYFKYSPKEYREIFKSKGYTTAQLKLIPKLRVWTVDEDELSWIVYSLFNEIIGFWVPDEMSRRIADRIFFQKIFKGSASGSVYDREEIHSDIKTLAEEFRRNATRFNDDINTKEKQVKEILKDISKGKISSGISDISTLSQKPDLMYFLLERIEGRKNLELDKWDNLWQACRVYMYPYQLFKVFNNNLKTKKNRQYILEFIEKSLAKLNTYFNDNYFEGEISGLLKVIIAKDPECHSIVLEIIKKQVEIFYRDVFFVEKKREGIHRVEEIGDALYSLSSTSTDEVKEEIYHFIIQTFNLVSDEQEFYRYTPGSIYKTVAMFLTQDNCRYLKERFLALCEDLSEQYNLFFKQFGKRLEFKGWELMGGGIGTWAGGYSVSDKAFISNLLRVAINELPEEDRWGFILERCITPASRVTRDRPDFLNRMAIPYTLERYAEGDIRAYLSLEEFLLSRKGIPHKADLIYQGLRDINCTDARKWDLVKVTIDKYQIPVNPFVEQIVSNLAKSGHKEALAQIEAWARNAEYYRQTFWIQNELVNNIRKILEVKPDNAIRIFKEFINSQYFIHELDSFEVRSTSSLLSEIILAEKDNGWRIWDTICRKRVLSRNQQLLLVGALNEAAKGEDNESCGEIFERLEKMTSNNKRFQKTFWDCYARQQVVSSVGELLKKGLEPRKGFRIIKRFIEDPDPSLENDPSDPEGDFNYHKKILEGEDPNIITSVRGEAVWVLRQTITTGIEPDIEDVISIIRRLVNDNNLYIRLYACFALERLAQVRDCKVGNKRFIQRAYSYEIESIAFEMLSDSTNKVMAIQKGMSFVFCQMRNLSYRKALLASNYFAEAHEDALKGYLLTILFFAEFNPRFTEIQKSRIRTILYALIEDKVEVRRRLAWHTWTITNEGRETGKDYLKITLGYLRNIIKEYDKETYSNVYRLIHENIGRSEHDDELIRIYKACIQKECDYLGGSAQEDNRTWDPYFYNGDILNAIFKINRDTFVEIFKMLVSYPINCHLGNIDESIDILYRMPKKKHGDVDYIFNKLIEKSAVFYERKKEWENNRNQAQRSRNHKVTSRNQSSSGN